MFEDIGEMMERRNGNSVNGTNGKDVDHTENEEFLEALLSYTQADVDGIMVNVSRQSIQETVDAYHTQAATITELQALNERLKQEAIKHAHEARAQRSTVHEINQIVSGATGEKADWNGAEPVRKAFTDLQARLKKSDFAHHQTIDEANAYYEGAQKLRARVVELEDFAVLQLGYFENKARNLTFKKMSKAQKGQRDSFSYMADKCRAALSTQEDG